METWKCAGAARRWQVTVRYALWPALVAVAVLTLGVGAGSADPPDTGGDVGTPVATTVMATRISVDEARQAASEVIGSRLLGLGPGVDVEGSIPKTPATNTPYVCYHTGWNSLWTAWGHWPYDQRVYETRTWCGYLNDRQTYRVSGVHGGGTACSWGAPTHVYRTAGGNGYFYTTVDSGVHFTCPIAWPPGLPPLNYDDWQRWRCNMAGSCTWVAAGRS